jgi:hypothetical protein
LEERDDIVKASVTVALKNMRLEEVVVAAMN